MPKVPVQGFSLSELVVSTADELRAASEKVKGKEPVLLFKGCDLELARSP